MSVSAEVSLLVGRRTWNRSLCLMAGLLTVLLAAALTVSACGESPLLTGLSLSTSLLRPDGKSESFVLIDYGLSRRADVEVRLLADDGKQYTLGPSRTRPPDYYQIKFNGAIGVDDSADRRVLPDGTYQVSVMARDASGRFEEQTQLLTISSADTDPPQISDVVAQPLVFSPNGDGIQDESTVGYTISKESKVTVFATDAGGSYSLLDPPTKRGDGPYTFIWDGKENGGRLLPDGRYTVHIRAEDAAGNVTEVSQEVTIDNGGIPRLELKKVKFVPTTVPVNGEIKVEVTVKNTGTTTIRWDESMGPAPGAEYTTDMTYAFWRNDKGEPLYYERNGVWRIGVGWDNEPRPYPFRWAIGKTLEPGEEATITGTIQILQSGRPEMWIWAGIEQGGVGFPGGRQGMTKITISY